MCIDVLEELYQIIKVDMHILNAGVSTEFSQAPLSDILEPTGLILTLFNLGQNPGQRGTLRYITNQPNKPISNASQPP